jgi:hypothetical protein
MDSRIKFLHDGIKNLQKLVLSLSFIYFRRIDDKCNLIFNGLLQNQIENEMLSSNDISKSCILRSHHTHHIFGQRS